MNLVTRAFGRGTGRIDRRRALRLGGGLTGAALLGRGSLGRGLAATGRSLLPGSVRHQAATTPTGWRTWHLTSAAELRPAAPGAAGDAAIEEVRNALANLSDERTAAVERWGTGPAVLAWSALTPDLHREFAVSGIRQLRNLALMHTAMHDAAIAAWDAQLAHGRPGPAATDDRGGNHEPPASTFPSEHVAVAGAAATVLAYLYPDAAGRFDALAAEAAESRIWAGAAFRSDVEAGLALGQAIGERAVTRGKADGSDVEFDPATMPDGPEFWQPTPPRYVEVPVEPLGGTWKTWVLAAPDQYRPAPPPEYGSSAWTAEVEAVREVVARRTLAQEAALNWWQSGDSLSSQWARDLILKAGLDLPHAARVLAYLTVGGADAVVAAWDAKYTWWTRRPITEDPDLATAFPMPNYPAYPSGYAAVAGVGELVLGHFFPDAADDLAELAWEAARSRAWAGIHYMIDNEVGLSMGRQIGRLVTALARADESAGGGASPDGPAGRSV